MTTANDTGQPKSELAHTHWFSVMRLMWSHHARITMAMILSGLIGGFASIAVIDTISQAIQSSGSEKNMLFRFVALSVIAILFTNCASLLPSYAGLKIITALRIALCKKILTAPLEEIEKRGTANVLTLLTLDIPRLAHTIAILPTLLVETIILIFGLIYLAYLSWISFFLTALSILVGIPLALYFFYRGINFFRTVRNEFVTFNEYSHDLVFGAKELKLNGDLRRWFKRAAIDLSAKKVASSEFFGNIWFTGSSVVTQIMYTLLIGLLLFGAPLFEFLASATLTGSILTIVYVMRPLSTLLATVPQLSEGVIACEHLANFGFSITDKKIYANSSDRIDRLPRRITEWNHIKLNEISVDYRSRDEPSNFELGPINLELKPGEILFIVGDNGSGKSTLAKIIAGLYLPTSGEILLDGVAVNEANRENYQSLFGAVFSDFHLFRRVIGAQSDTENIARAQTYLSTLDLLDKVQIDRRFYSTTKALSNGQRKRLALLCAYLEDRPIYLLDEWAADQDYSFKKFFYEVLLPDLKRRGKCAIVITHDDQFFPLADRIIRLSGGRIYDCCGNTIPPSLS